LPRATYDRTGTLVPVAGAKVRAMPSKDASKKTAKGFAEILSVARAAGLTAPEPDAAQTRKGALYYLALNDPVMSAALQSARESLPGFLSLTKHPGPTMERFAVKIALLGDGGPEFFWIYPFAYVGDRFIGQINNMPLTLAGPKKGDTVTFGRHDIVDWVYMDAGVMKGNYSARAILKAALPRDSAVFKRRFGPEFDI
jgi:uncharacterized protein YegJ (DUF2314 family)